jgi:hypothetical protein
VKINKKEKTKPPSKTTLGSYLTGFESLGGRISGFILWGMKYSTLDSLGGYVDFFLFLPLWWVISLYPN